jgi:hypothetical protein
VLTRLQRHGLADQAIVVPHEPVPPGPWKLEPPALRGRKLRIAVLGVLAEQKGAPAVIALADAADPATIELHLIGYPEKKLPTAAAGRITVTGEYQDGELPGLLARVKPHVVWFPAQWPETYSYTLSAALDAGLPVVATRIGSFVERLEGRPLSWLVDPRADTATWLATFAQVRAALASPRSREPVPPRPAVADFYAEQYLRTPAIRRPGTLADLRRGGRRSIVVIPERLQGGPLSPCAYIRLLQPLDHPAIAGDFAVVLADAAEAQRYHADIIATQRYAISDIATADALAAHCRRTGATLLYDMDDDLLHIPREHADANLLRPRAKTVQRMLRHADAVFVSTPMLADSLAAQRPDVRVVPNGLDERLWGDRGAGAGPRRRVHGGPVRILCMGTATHEADFALIEPALARLEATFHGRVAIDMLGVSTRADLPEWINRPVMSLNASASYPGFVNWITQEPGWDIGLAPLVDSAFNRGKSAIKTLDYAALGMTVVASDVAPYRGSLADGPGGMLVANEPGAWFAALSRLVRDAELRRGLAAGAVAAFNAQGTLASQAETRRAAWLALAPRMRAERAA